jgi:hypothetical protein
MALDDDELEAIENKEYQEQLEGIINDSDKTPEDIEDLKYLTGNKPKEKKYIPPTQNYF